MAARIRSVRNGILPVDEASRNDLVAGDLVVVSSLDAATTYNWTIVFAPAGSTATFSGSSTAVSPGSFTVDLAGPYLIRLVVDQSLGSQSTQYVRLRALTTALGLSLVAAGERRDGTGIIPVDVSPEGWANDQNANLQALEAAIASDPAAIVGSGGAGTAGDATATGGTATSGTADGGDVLLTPGTGVGGGSNGKIKIKSADGTKGVSADAETADTLTVDTDAGGGKTIKLDAAAGRVSATSLKLEDLAAATNTVYIELADGQSVAVSAASTARIRYNHASLRLEKSINGGAYSELGGGGGAGGGILSYLQNMQPAPNMALDYRGWASVASTLTAARVRMMTINTQGAYTIAVSNDATVASCLVAGSFNMNTLVAGVVTDLTLTATPADLVFAAGGGWTVTLTSDDPAFDGEDIYFELQFTPL